MSLGSLYSWLACHSFGNIRKFLQEKKHFPIALETEFIDNALAVREGRGNGRKESDGLSQHDHDDMPTGCCI